MDAPRRGMPRQVHRAAPRPPIAVSSPVHLLPVLLARQGGLSLLALIPCLSTGPTGPWRPGELAGPRDGDGWSGDGPSGADVAVHDVGPGHGPPPLAAGPLRDPTAARERGCESSSGEIRGYTPQQQEGQGPSAPTGNPDISSLSASLPLDFPRPLRYIRYIGTRFRSRQVAGPRGVRDAPCYR